MNVSHEKYIGKRNYLWASMLVSLRLPGGMEYIFLVAGKALHWNGKARMRSFFSERNFFFSAINSFFFEIWMVVKTERSEVLAVQIEKKKELIKEKKIFLKEKKRIRDLPLKIATFFSY